MHVQMCTNEVMHVQLTDTLNNNKNLDKQSIPGMGVANASDLMHEKKAFRRTKIKAEGSRDAAKLKYIR